MERFWEDKRTQRRNNVTLPIGVAGRRPLTVTAQSDNSREESALHPVLTLTAVPGSRDCH